MRSLNRIYRTIWSETRKAWVVVSELAKGRGKGSGAPSSVAGSNAWTFYGLKPAAVALACCYAVGAQANPTGGQVVHGSAGIVQSGSVLTVTNSPNAIINWQGFSIGSGETTQFIQQSSSSAVLNRVVGTDPSVLLGTLSSNGKVFLINPSGILVGQGARIDVAGLVASTLNLTDSDFLAGKLNFGGNAGAGSVKNAGSIVTPEGGQVYLIAPQVENSGIITTPQGETILAAGSTVELLDTATPGVTVQVTGEGESTNLGRILADSGRVGMVGALVRNDGVLSADSLVSKGGRVFLQSSRRIEAGGEISARGAAGGGEIEVIADKASGVTEVTGVLDASAPVLGDGGFIETSAGQVKVSDSAAITTRSATGSNGTWLIDPFNFTIASYGGDITGTALGTALGSTDVTIETALGSVSCSGATCGSGNSGDGDIFVNDGISWSSAHKLTLHAYRNIGITAAISGSSGTLTLNAPGAVTQSAPITVSQLELLGGGGYTLTNSSNAVSTLAGDVGSVDLISSANVTIGTVNSTVGLTATDDISVSSAGTLSIGQAVTSGGGRVTLSAVTGMTQGADIYALKDIVLTANANSGSGNFTQNAGVISNVQTNRDNSSAVLTDDASDITINAHDIDVSSVSSSLAAVLNASGGIHIGSGFFNGGTARNYTGVDDNAFSYTLPFGFTFYGVTYNSMFISSNGVISFGNGVLQYVNSDANFIAGISANLTGSTAGPSIAPAWSDWVTYGAGHNTSSGHDIYIGQPSTNLLAVRWDVANFSNQSYTANFEAVLSQAGNITFNYGAATAMAPHYTATIGVTKGDGTHYTLSTLNDPSTLNNMSSLSYSYDAGTGNYVETVLGSGAGGSGISAETAVKLTAAGLLEIGNAISAATISGLGGTGVTLDALGTLTASSSGNAIVLNAGGGDFTNLAGSSALSVPHGRWLIYSANPESDTFGGLASGNLALWGREYDDDVDDGVLMVSETGNRYLFSYVPTITVSAGSLTKVYGTDLTQTPPAAAITGLIDASAYGNVFTQEAVSGTPALSSEGFAANALVSGSPYGVSVAAGTFVAPAGYATTYSGGTLTITPLAVSLAVTLSGTKVYDGTTTFSTGQLSISNVVAGDAVSLSAGTADTADRNVGVDKPFVSFSGLALTGANAGNYTLAGVSGTGTITPAALTISAVTDSRVYNGTTASSVLPVVTGTLFGTDSVGGLVQAFASRNALGANGSTLNVSGYAISDGNGGGNYTVTLNAAQGTITPRSVTLVASAANKIYDGTLGYTATAGDLTALGAGLVGGDTVTSATLRYTNADVGTGKTVTLSGVAINDGNNGGNYLVTLSGSTAGVITVRPLSTWTGLGGNTLWSNAANWDVLPSGSNVLAVSIPAGSSVSYDAAANAVLQGIANAGNLVLNSGLSVVNYAQTAGSLSGSGNFTVTNSFSVTGGTLGLTGTVAITQTTGDLNFTNVGAFRIGRMVALNGALNVDNTGAVTIDGDINGTTGISVVAHSPLTINGTVSSGGNIVLTAGNTPGAGDDLTLNGTVSTTGSGATIALVAGDNMAQNANVTSNGGAVSATAQTGGITMAAGTSTSTGGGSVGYAAAGNVVLSSLNAGSGSISLTVGGNVSSAPGTTGANLVGGTALLNVTGNAVLTTQVQQVTPHVGGSYTIIDPASGSVTSSTPLVPTQLLSTTTTVTTTSGGSGNSTTTSVVTTPVVPTTTTILTGGNSGDSTIGGTAGTFGGGSTTGDGKGSDDQKKSSSKSDSEQGSGDKGGKSDAKKPQSC